MTVAEGRRIAVAAKRRDVLVGTGFMMRHTAPT